MLSAVTHPEQRGVKRLSLRTALATGKTHSRGCDGGHFRATSSDVLPV